MMINKLKFADYITMLSLVCGTLSIFFSVMLKFDIATILLVLAAIFDYLDGKIARLLKQLNAMGVELDSLSDVVSFGVAPAVFVYMHGRNDILSLTVLCLFVLAGAIRLAHFNTNRQTSRGFYTGMPITMNAFIVPLAMAFLPKYIMYVMVLSAVFMLSPVKIRKWNL